MFLLNPQILLKFRSKRSNVIIVFCVKKKIRTSSYTKMGGIVELNFPKSSIILISERSTVLFYIVAWVAQR